MQLYDSKSKKSSQSGLLTFYRGQDILTYSSFVEAPLHIPKGGVYSSFEAIEVQGLAPGFDLRPKGVAVRWARKKYYILKTKSMTKS